ncbi:hypothetical protein HMF7854_04090 [Sphingomonas ginkgonis]|uniref:Secreted protein n=1 Tax=Sphingomonas ginkgonis TaxID=2315330 RepID=A0A429V829_9SPHN|nr:hypothetical protein [Sphingomonas ginkgonis]RST30095.1 hypothetical protein HMF7854_04090 [Sphingomonas ginkgonis]
MRSMLLAAPLLLVAVPAAAQYAPPHPPPYGYDVPPPYGYTPPPPGPGSQLGAVLDDPHLADRVTDLMHGLTDAVLDLPVGDLQAAVEGRPPTRRDHDRTLGSGQTRRDIHRQIAESRGTIRAGQQAMQRSLPLIANAVGQASEQISRALDNLPSPAYPHY